MTQALHAVELVERLRDSQNDFDLMAAARALASLGSDAKGAAPELVSLLNTGRSPQCEAAAFVLSEIGPAAIETAPALMDTLLTRLYDRNGEVRHWITVAIARLGSLALPAIPQLIEALGDSDEGVRLVSAHALGELGPAASDAIDPLLQALNDLSTGVRLAAACALPKVDPAGRRCVHSLAQALLDDSASVRHHAAEALGILGPLSKPAVPGLLRCLIDPDPEVRLKGVQTLGKVHDTSEEVIRAISVLLTDSEGQVRCEAAQALRRLSRGSRAVTQLVAAVTDPDEMVRYHVVEALETIAATAPDSLATITLALSRCLRDESSLVQTRTISALGSLASQGGVVERTLTELLVKGEPDVKVCCIQALSRRRDPDVGISSLIGHLLTDGSLRVRMAAAVALAGMGKAPSSFVDVMGEGLQHEDGRIQISAIKGLSEHAAHAKPAASLLEQKADSGNAVIRALAKDALKRIEEEG